MSRRVLVVIASVLGGFIAGGGAKADHAAHSPAAEVRAALDGATVEGQMPDGRTYRISYAPDGMATLRTGDATEAGRWQVDKGGHYCETWPKAFEGKTRCGGIEVAGPLLILRGTFRTTRNVVSAVAPK